jgi:hypothetical protein
MFQYEVKKMPCWRARQESFSKKGGGVFGISTPNLEYKNFWI